MSNAEIAIPEQVKQCIEKLMVENDLEKTAEIEYGQGSELGDGYTSQTYLVDINDGKKSLNVFLKVPYTTSWHEGLPMKKLFDNERYFYNTIYPAYQEFLKERKIEDGFRNVPKCYAVDGNIIALENLQKKNFCMFSKGRLINDAHFSLVVKTFAKFHALSFAFKDQKKELYEHFKANIQFCMRDLLDATGHEKVLTFLIPGFLKNVDPIEDKYILDACDNLLENLLDVMLNVDNLNNEYSTIMQGDSWTNNMMYLYEEGNQDDPVDMMLIDWQLPRIGSPATDLAYFFYTISSESTLENLDYYMKVYHEELSKGIRELGSDPDILYPFSVFKEEWRKFARYGLAMAFVAVKSMLMEKDEMPNVEDWQEIFEKILNNADTISDLLPRMRNEDVYISRMKMILKHFIKNGFLL